MHAATAAHTDGCRSSQNVAYLRLATECVLCTPQTLIYSYLQLYRKVDQGATKAVNPYPEQEVGRDLDFSLERGCDKRFVRILQGPLGNPQELPWREGTTLIEGMKREIHWSLFSLAVACYGSSP